tara:strand:- start:4458 stop:4667 length:210 start_codon:yes stop_codon:yes gene_type:complete
MKARTKTTVTIELSTQEFFVLSCWGNYKKDGLSRTTTCWSKSDEDLLNNILIEQRRLDDTDHWEGKEDE